MNKKLLGIALTLASLPLGTVASYAADRGVAPRTAATSIPGTIRPMAKRPANLKTIFSNLGSKTDAYDASNGYFVSGPNNTLNAQKQDLAVPFTPKANGTVTVIEFALQYYGYGFNGAHVEIAADSSGVPGSALSTQDIQNFGDFGSGCCVLKSVHLKHTVSVKKGVQYWVVATTDRKCSSDSVNTWDFVWNDAAGSFAFQQDNGGWTVLTQSDGYAPPAVAVLGQ